MSQTEQETDFGIAVRLIADVAAFESSCQTSAFAILRFCSRTAALPNNPHQKSDALTSEALETSICRQFPSSVSTTASSSPEMIFLPRKISLAAAFPINLSNRCSYQQTPKNEPVTNQISGDGISTVQNYGCPAMRRVTQRRSNLYLGMRTEDGVESQSCCEDEGMDGCHVLQMRMDCFHQPGGPRPGSPEDLFVSSAQTCNDSNYPVAHEERQTVSEPYSNKPVGSMVQNDASTDQERDFEPLCKDVLQANSEFQKANCGPIVPYCEYSAKHFRPNSKLGNCYQTNLIHPETITFLRLSLRRRQWSAHLLLKPLRFLQQLRCIPLARRSSSLRMLAAGLMRPHPHKDSGEDSFFLSGDHRGIGVADGVSEWRTFGVNPGRFADQLMAFCRSIVDSHKFTCGLPCNSAKIILREAFNKVTAFGGSTALIAVLDECGTSLEVANLGDSTICVFRRDHWSGKAKLFMRSQELQHTFNLPYQLTHIPSLADVPQLMRDGCQRLAELTVKMHNSDRSFLDSADDAQCYNVPLREGDLVLLATDGVFDNLHEEEISELVSTALSPVEAYRCGCPELATSALDVSRAVVECAFARSIDQEARTPFVLNAEKAGVRCAQELGGKRDDITVVAAWIT